LGKAAIDQSKYSFQFFEGGNKYMKTGGNLSNESYVTSYIADVAILNCI
jgi:hypothetical protein